VNSRRVILLASLLALLVCSVASVRTARGWCQLPEPWNLWWEPGVTTVSVKVNIATDQLCQAHGGASDCADLDDVVRVVRQAMDEWNDDAGANIRFRWAGIENVKLPGELLPNYVHIFPGPLAPDVAGKGEQTDDSGNGYADSCRITLNPDVDFSPGGQFNGISLAKVVAHELGHCLSFAHPDGKSPGGCDQYVASVMNTGHRSEYESFQGFLYRDDIAAAQIGYGTRSTATARGLYSNDALNWNYNSLLGPSDVAHARTRYSITNSSLLYYWAYISYPRDILTDRIRFAKLNGSSWSYLGQLPSTAKTVFHTATASDNAGEVAISYLGNYDNASGESELSVIETTDSGASWGTPRGLQNSSWGPHTTPANGVAGTWDPATQNYVWAWRTKSNNIMVYTEAGNWMTVPHPSGTGFSEASDTPGIACAPTSVVGAENCLVTWGGSEWDRALHWVQGHIDPSTSKLVVSAPDIQTHPVIPYGQPAVAYTGDSTWPWVLTYHQGSKYAYTWRKGPSPSDDWDGFTSKYTWQYAVSPVVGSVYYFCWPSCTIREQNLVFHGGS